MTGRVLFVLYFFWWIPSAWASDELPNLRCIHEIQGLSTWKRRSFELRENLVNATEASGVDAIEIQTGSSARSTSTAIVDFQVSTPPERRLAYWDIEDTAANIGPYILSGDQQWLAHFHQDQLKIAIYDLNDDQNRRSDGRPSPQNALRVVDLKDFLKNDIDLELSESGFAPRISFQNNRILISTPVRVLEFHIRSGDFLRGQQSSTAGLGPASFWQGSILIPQSDTISAQTRAGMAEVHTPLIDSIVGLHPIQIDDGPALAAAQGRKILILRNESRDSPLRFLPIAGFDSAHEGPITWIQSYRNRLLTYSRTDQVLHWWNLEQMTLTPRP